MEYLYVVKIGGDVINNRKELEKFLDRFAALKARKILVHGGGRSADQLLQALGIRMRFIEGKRVIEPRVLDVLKVTYSGINKDLTAALQKRMNDAFGLSGIDGCFIQAERKTSAITNYGLVGEVKGVKNGIVQALLQADMIPVISPLTLDLETGEILHTNADLIASSVASALASEYRTHLIYSFGLAGVFKKFSRNLRGKAFVSPKHTDDDAEMEGGDDSEAELIQTLNDLQYSHLLEEEAIHGGMVLKLDCGFDALRAGVYQVHVCHSSQIASNGRVCEGTRLTIDSLDSDSK